MRRPSAPSRRAFLAGAATTGTAALAGCTAAYGVVPDRFVYARTHRRGVPKVPAAVETSDAHLEATADEIADYAARGLEAWERIDEPSPTIRYSSRVLERAAEFAEALPTEPPTVDTVESMGYYLSRAAGGYAYAVDQTDGFDGDPTADVDAWLEEAAHLHGEFAYETDDPETFLAYGRSIEYSLQQASAGLSRRADADVNEHDSRSAEDQLAQIYSSVQRSRLRVLDAAAYRETLRERDAGGEPFRDAIVGRRAVLRDHVDDRLADHEAWSDRFDSLEGERRDVQSALYSRSHGWRSNARAAERHVENGYEVYGTTVLAECWLGLEAARAERERIEDDGTDALDAVVVDETKRDAVDRLERALDDEPGPMTRHLLSTCRSHVEWGDRGIERGQQEDDDEDRRWNRANGYAHYLLARGMLERVPDLVATLTDGRDRY